MMLHFRKIDFLILGILQYLLCLLMFVDIMPVCVDMKM